MSRLYPAKGSPLGKGFVFADWYYSLGVFPCRKISDYGTMGSNVALAILVTIVILRLGSDLGS